MIESLMYKEASKKEGRRVSRFRPDNALRVIVTLEHRGEKATGVMDDVGIGGIGLRIINSSYIFPVNSLVMITIESPDEIIELFARVVYSLSRNQYHVRRYGLAFFKEHAAIKQLIQRYC